LKFTSYIEQPYSHLFHFQQYVTPDIWTEELVRGRIIHNSGNADYFI